MPTYYRALTNDDAHCNWKKGKYIGYHNYPANDWVNIWKKTSSTDPKDYPLKCSNGIFTLNARDSFVELYPKLKPNSVFSQEECRRLSELVGVFAFLDPQSAFDYGSTSEKLHGYVVFEGEYICQASEPNGVIAKVLDIDKIIYSTDEFKEKYKAEIKS